MKKFKKLFAVGLALGLVLVLGACDKKVSTLEEVQEKNELAYGVVETNEPFEFEDENGELVGLDVDIAEEIADRLGVEAKPVKIEDEERIISSLVASDYDIVVGTIPMSDEKKAQIEFTQPYYEESMTEEDLIDGERLAVAVKKSDQMFLDAVDEALEDMKEDGTYKELTEKWLDEDITAEVQ